MTRRTTTLVCSLVLGAALLMGCHRQGPPRDRVGYGSLYGSDECESRPCGWAGCPPCPAQQYPEQGHSPQEDPGDHDPVAQGRDNPDMQRDEGGWQTPMSRSRCPSLPQTAPPGQVSLYTAAAPDYSRLLCVRAVNGMATTITYGLLAFRLQRKGVLGWGARIFPPETLPPAPGGVVASAALMAPGAWAGVDLPSFQYPLPAGRYRACFRFAAGGEGQQWDREICSTEVVLP